MEIFWASESWKAKYWEVAIRIENRILNPFFLLIVNVNKRR